MKVAGLRWERRAGAAPRGDENPGKSIAYRQLLPVGRRRDGTPRARCPAIGMDVEESAWEN
jgi:hypothetical protein